MFQGSDGLLARLKLLDSQFRYQTKARDDADRFLCVTGSLPVLVSAPHACMHSRNGEGKMQEEYTGAIALYLAEVCQCSAVVTRYRIDEDPNWDQVSDYKARVQFLVEQNNIQFLIDLHGMTNRYNMGVAIGTIKERACSSEMIVPHFTDAGFIINDADATKGLSSDGSPSDWWRSLVVDHTKFTGGLVNHTVTRFASQQLNIPSVQIELASEVRVVESEATQDWPQSYVGHPPAIEAVVNALQSLVVSQKQVNQ